MDEFEVWLRKVCFQKPTKEAHALAKAAWSAGKLSATKDMIAKLIK